MTRLRNWIRGSIDTRSASAPRVVRTTHNAATHATVDTLIALQRQAGDIDLKSARPALAALAGAHESRFRGRGMDYQQSRVYEAGDDIRSMDWRVTARTGKPHTKLYQEERERPVLLFVDFSPSMFFATRGTLKSVAAARAAALIGWAAAAHSDRIGAVLVNGGHRELQPRGGRRGVLRLIQQLVEITDPRHAFDGQTPYGGINAALARMRRVSRPGSLIFLIGDFYGIDDETGNHLTRLRQHSDVAAIQVVDPLEVSAPLPARYGVTCGSRAGVLDLRTASARRAYQDHFSRHHEAVAQLMRKRAIPLWRLSTDDDVAMRLRRHFAVPVAASKLRRLAA
ncbi:MAG: DUF58 domain-containing protein [Burkholderiales bacterium]|nr:DUF58 domain-containing protein [Burkholderiales bacterium]